MLRKLNELVCRKGRKLKPTWAAGLGIFFGIAPNFDGGEVIMKPPGPLVEFPPRIFPGLNGLIAPLAPLARPGGSWRINFPLKNGVPCKKWTFQKSPFWSFLKKCKGKIGLVLPDTSLSATWLLLAMSIARKSAFSANLTKQKCRISNCATFL